MTTTLYSCMARRQLQRPDRQAGLTLVELLVAMVLSAVITIAAISALVFSRQGFTAVDAASQLRDNARYASDFIQRLGAQAGYRDFQVIASPPTLGAPTLPPNVGGFNNALIAPGNPTGAFNARPVGPALGGSDILILRFQGAETFVGSGVSDNSMIDCAGNPAADPGAQITSIFHQDVDLSGQPSLMCTVLGGAAPQPIIQGVESFQVLYGIDSGVTGTPPNRYVRADEIVGAITWSMVRSLRIGMVFVGPAASAQDNVAITYFPLGDAPGAAGGAAGSALSSANDPGTRFQPGADGRLRKTQTFTVHLRND
jgi:type IV pilus assembly protein PilW